MGPDKLEIALGTRLPTLERKSKATIKVNKERFQKLQNIGKSLSGVALQDHTQLRPCCQQKLKATFSELKNQDKISGVVWDYRKEFDQID